MKIVRTEGGEYNDCIVKYFDLFDYDTNDPNSVLFWGWSSIDNEEKKAEYENYSKKYFINTAMPCEIIGGYVDILKQSYFDEVLTICPYTANVLNYGNLHHNLYYDLIRSISKFNYAFSAISHYNQTEEIANLITHFNIPSQEKWDLISKCKMSVGFNLIFLREDQISNLKSTQNIKAFKGIDKVYETAMMPQFKTRMVEAAACKTLMLMYKDNWNVIEEWFEPNKHFLYWETFEQLEVLIKDVSDNYEKYWHIVEAANEHVQQYLVPL